MTGYYGPLAFLFAGYLMLRLNEWMHTPGCVLCGGRSRHNKRCPEDKRGS